MTHKASVRKKIEEQLRFYKSGVKSSLITAAIITCLVEEAEGMKAKNPGLGSENWGRNKGLDDLIRRLEGEKK